MKLEVALQANPWYNKGRKNMFAVAMLLTSYGVRRTCIGGSSMDILPQDNMPRKKCSGPCDRLLPATPEFFMRNTSNKDGLAYYCKACEKAHRNSPEQKAKKREYDRAYRARLDVHARKLVYHRNYNRRYYQDPANQEKRRVIDKRSKSRPEIREAQRQWRKEYGQRPEVRERIRAYERNRPHVFPETQAKILARRKAYYHGPRGRAWYRAYASRPDVRERGHARAANRRARKKNAVGIHTAEQLRSQYQRQKGTCYYCQQKVEWGKHHVDHVIPLSRGGSNDISNLVITCPSCNISKRAKLPHEFFEGGRLL